MPNIDHKTLDRARGAFIGLAVGDAVGTTVEFKARGTFEPVKDMIGGGRFDLKPGQWTDDTSMAICLAESLIAHPDGDMRDLMTRFEEWMALGRNSSTGVCFDIGITTSHAIRRFQDNGDPMAGSTNSQTAGNGSVMRLSPIPIRWWRDPSVAVALARQQSQTTHAAAEAVDGCALLARVLCAAIQGAGIAALEQDEASWAPAIRAIGQARYCDKTERQIRSSGYVVDTLEAAFWVVRRAETFQAAILAAANLGADADTIGAVAGQIAGALWGYQAIPEHWRGRLHDHNRLRGICDELFKASLESSPPLRRRHTAGMR